MQQSQLKEELQAIEGLRRQNPETGKFVGSGTTFVGQYTNRVFGAPFQLMDSVDKRFSNVNSHLGSEYLRNFMLNAPILHIRPGMPKYTGGEDQTSLWNDIKKIYFASNSSNFSGVQSLLESLAAHTIFGNGSKLQRRLFGFRETYYDYMQHVNYMCRSVAVFLNLTEGTKFPNGTFTNDGPYLQPFSSMKWENYRMLTSSKVLSPTEYLRSLLGGGIDETVNGLFDIAIDIGNVVGWLTAPLAGDSDDLVGMLGSQGTWEYARQLNDMTFDGSMSGAMEEKITDVQLMVEPTSFEETLTNDTKTSLIESSIDAIGESLGSEIGFITNSHSDFGIIDNVLEFLGSTVETAGNALSSIVEPVTGGFMQSLFSGALQSIKGQKMIYPEIYQGSTSSMNYNFSITLATPYGDIYNYYMNILVPLMHLICLAAPRMVTANSTASPFLVQAYLPGQCTCQLGIINTMTISKNPNGTKVSVNGFPLEIKVSFSIKELYNAMSISPANDPTSFLFNETLNDYMSNLAGLVPSVDTYNNQRRTMFENLESYLVGGGFAQDMAAVMTEKVENAINPFIAR